MDLNFVGLYNHSDDERNESDCELEGRLYAEIYYSSNIDEGERILQKNSNQTVQSTDIEILQSNENAILNTPSDIFESFRLSNDLSSIDDLENSRNSQDVLKIKENPNSSSIKNNNRNHDHNNEEVSNKKFNSLPVNSSESSSSPSRSNGISSIEEFENRSQSSAIKRRRKQDKKRMKVSRISPALLTPTSRKKKIDSENFRISRHRKREKKEIELNSINLRKKKSNANDNLSRLLSEDTVRLLISLSSDNKQRICPDTSKQMSMNNFELAVERESMNDDLSNVKEIMNFSPAKVKRSQQSSKKFKSIEVIKLDSSSDDDILSSDKVDDILEIQEGNKKEDERSYNPCDLYLDSEESILEIPLPPKPSPPLIDLNESHEDSSESSDSDVDGIHVISPGKRKKGKCQKKLSKNPERSSNSESSDLEFSENLEIGSNLILNLSECEKNTVIPKVIQSSGETATSRIDNLDIGSKKSHYASIVLSKISNKHKKINDSIRQNSVKKKKTLREKTDEEYFFEPMLNEIKSFYNNSWGGENFSVEEVQKRMRKDSKYWSILDEDLKPYLLKRQRYFLKKIRCTLCRQEGHSRANCPEPKKKSVCYMCGIEGHSEPRCPLKICLTCGSKQNTYRDKCELCPKLSCTLCHSKGHEQNFCPDLWRQYHFTTSETNYQLPKSSKGVMKPANLLICCNCTMRGHDASTCKKYRWTHHYPTPSYVSNYEKCRQIVLMNESSSSKSPDFNLFNEVTADLRNSQSFTNDIQELSSQNKDPSVGNIRTLFSIQIPIEESGEGISQNLNKKICTERINMSSVEGAVLKGMIDGTVSFEFLKYLCRILRCDVHITYSEDEKVLLTVSYHEIFSERTYFKKIINHWLRLSDDDKDLIVYKELIRNKLKLTNLLKHKFECLCSMKNNMKKFCHNIQSLEKRKTNTEKWRRFYNRIRSKLVMLLYKNDCSFEETGVYQKLKNIYENLMNSNWVTLNNYILIFYYYNLMFSSYTPWNLSEMMERFWTTVGNSEEITINQDVNEDTYERNISRYIHKEEQSEVKAGDNSSSCPSINKNSINNSQKCQKQEKLLLSAGKNLQNSKSCIVDISKEDLLVHNSSNSSLCSSQKFNSLNKSLKKKETNSLIKIVSVLMTQALRFNVPEITNEAIRIGEIMDRNELDWCQLERIRYLIKSHKRRLRKKKKRSK